MKKNIIWLVCLSLLYVPVLLIDLWMFIGNGMCYPCGCWDLVCHVKHDGYAALGTDLLGLFFFFLLNLLFIIPIFTYLKKILTELKKPSNDGGNN